MAEKMTVIIRRNASYEKGMYGLSIHEGGGGAALVHPINSVEELRERLLGFGLSEGYSDDVIDRLKKKHDSVTIEVDRSS